MTNERSHSAVLDWIDQRSAWQFVAVLYITRWVALTPVMVLGHFVLTDSQKGAASVPETLSEVNAGLLLLAFVVVSPLMETLIECALPYLIISRIRNYRQNRPKRCWGFVAVSACVMALLHPALGAIIPSLITGAFLAYCYAHFSEKGVGQAIVATVGFHGAINVVGWTMIVMS